MWWISPSLNFQFHHSPTSPYLSKPIALILLQPWSSSIFPEPWETGPQTEVWKEGAGVAAAALFSRESQLLWSHIPIESTWDKGLLPVLVPAGHCELAFFPPGPLAMVLLTLLLFLHPIKKRGQVTPSWLLSPLLAHWPHYIRPS
jgi:hypothetical protein